MNITLFKHNFGSLIKPLFAIMCLLTLYFGVIVWMFNPSLLKSLESFSQTMPAMMSMFGMAGSVGTLTGFMSTYLYGFLMIILPLIFVIIASQRLVVSHVDSGSMAGLLAAPVSRRKVVTTQMLTLMASILIIIVYCTIIGIVFSEIMFKGKLDIQGFIYMNIGALVLHVAVGGLCFFGSCLFNETKNALIIAAGVPLIQYLIKMLADMGNKAANLKYGTFYTLFNPSELAKGSSFGNIAILIGGGIIFYVLAIKVFCKKDLNI